MNKTNLLKLGLSLVLCFVLLSKVDTTELAEVMLSLDYLYFTAALLITPVLYASRTYRWQIMMRSLGFNNTFLELFKVLMIGVFYGLITPGKIGEVGRVLHLRGEKPKIIATIIFEKILDISILLILSVVTVLLYFNNLIELKYLTIGIAVFMIAFFLALISKRLSTIISSILKRDASFANQCLEPLWEIRKNHRLLLMIFSISAFYYLIVYLISFLTLYSLGISYKVIITIPLIILIGNIPITIAGIGLRESVGTVCFLYLGESAVNGLSFSLLLFIIITVIPSLFGYVLSISAFGVSKSKTLQYKP